MCEAQHGVVVPAPLPTDQRAAENDAGPPISRVPRESNVTKRYGR